VYAALKYSSGLVIGYVASDRLCHEKFFVLVYRLAEAYHLNVHYYLYPVQKHGGVAELNIQLDGEIVWRLTSFESLADDVWNLGQIETDGKKVLIQAVQLSDNGPGYAALDEITFMTVDDCTTEPPEATVGPPVETTPSPGC
jgi:hypothetical protein